MKNLENYGVLELNPQEMREVEGGGWFPWVTISSGWFNTGMADYIIMA